VSPRYWIEEKNVLKLLLTFSDLVFCQNLNSYWWNYLEIEWNNTVKVLMFTPICEINNNS
jgi:hypothetical protein